MSEIKVTVRGKASFKSILAVCTVCQYQEDRSVDMRPFDNEEDAISAELMSIPCPNCYSTAWTTGITCPTISKIGPEGSDSCIAAMKQSFKQRFIKKELDDVKHKYGADAVSDSLKGGLAEKIKTGKVEE